MQPLVWVAGRGGECSGLIDRVLSGVGCRGSAWFGAHRNGVVSEGIRGRLARRRRGATPTRVTYPCFGERGSNVHAPCGLAACGRAARAPSDGFGLHRHRNLDFRSVGIFAQARRRRREDAGGRPDNAALSAFNAPLRVRARRKAAALCESPRTSSIQRAKSLWARLTW